MPLESQQRAPRHSHVPAWSEGWQVAASQTLAPAQRPLEFPAHVVRGATSTSMHVHDTAVDTRPAAPTSEPLAWLLAKHAAQLGVVAAVITFVLQGSGQPYLSLAYALSSIAFLVVVALVDRARFGLGDAATAPIVVEVVAPVQPAAPDPVHVLAPLQEQIAAALTRVEVT